jgi:hypothetical protein
MKTSAKLFALGMILIGFGANVNAQVSSTAAASATARIVKPIAIEKNVDMSFGNIEASASLGTVVLEPSSANSRTHTGGATLPAVTGIVTTAKFTVTGEALLTYNITLPASTDLSDGTHTMVLDHFTSTPSATGLLSADPGTQIVYVGATLNVAANQATGSYAGTFNVTVNYN